MKITHEEQRLTDDFRRQLQRLYQLEAEAKELRSKTPTSEIQHLEADLTNLRISAARVELRQAERALAQLRERRSR